MGKMISTQQVEELIKDKLEEKDFFIVELDIAAGNSISLEIDSLDGVNIKDCIDFSKTIEGSLDREEEDFELHVSSAGLDKPLRVKKQYVKNIGKEISVVKIEGKKIKGELIEVDDEAIVVGYSYKEKIEGRKKKQTIVKQEKILFDNIKETTIIISFK